MRNIFNILAMAIILKPKDGTYALPDDIQDPSDLFKYIAEYNGIQYYETDITGYTPNDLKPDMFFADRIDQYAPNFQLDQSAYTGVLFIGVPVDIGIDVNASTFTGGQFENIVKQMLNKGFATMLRNYIACDYQFVIQTIRPLYNSVKYTKATNCSGVEIQYQIIL